MQTEPEEAKPSPAPEARSGKRLIIACDGTWMNSDNGFERSSYFPWDTNGHLQTPSNVTRICRALQQQSDDGIPQIIYYQAGIGTEAGFLEHIYGGGTGAGLSENIREAYAFVVNNYKAGDEIFLMGFSRGAFTARSIGGLIACAGLLTSVGMSSFYHIFKEWENQNNPHYRSRWNDRPATLPPRMEIARPAYAKELERLGLSRLNIPIKAIGVWDTVGSLGIPDIGLWQHYPKEYSFIDTRVSPIVEHAFQALALDEHRRPFSPTVWEKPAGQANPKILKQCWFPGVHGNIGGSYDDTNMADITLAWMISQLSPFLSFSPDYIPWQHDLNTQFYAAKRTAIRPWGLGKIYNSMKGIEALAGSRTRSPGHYFASDPKTGKPTAKELVDTRETVHSSVRVRMGVHNRGTEDKGVYRPAALKGWRLVGEATQPNNNHLRWEFGEGKMPEKVMMEDDLGEVEVDLLARSQEAYEIITKGPVKRRWTEGV